MNGVYFDDFHSFYDMNLILNSKQIGAPAVKKKEVEIPGADGTLDLTEWFGLVHYQSRTLSFTFTTAEPRFELLNVFSDVQNLLHGKRVRVTLDDDPDFYYIGRASLSPFKIDKVLGVFSVDVDCKPYKYKILPTVVEISVIGSKSVKFNNLNKRVFPVFKTTGNIQIIHNGYSYSLQAGKETVFTEVYFDEGETEITFSGNATVTVTYQEGKL